MTSPTTDKPSVLIVGAGLGGLVLAQSLQNRSIPFQIFERDENPTARSQGWAISLEEQMIEDLESNLPATLPDIRSTSHLSNTSWSSELAVYDARTMREFLRRGKDHGSPFVRANRGKLRDWLLTDINVQWNKRFSHYEESSTGVTAHFSDGTSATGTLLVGADGVHSRVRRHFLPDSPGNHPKPLPLGVIIGELTATREQYERWMKMGRSLMSGATSNGRCAVALKNVADDRESAVYYWILGWYDAEAEMNDQYWTHSASQEGLHKGMLEKLGDVHESLAEILRATPVEGMLHPPLRMLDMTPPELPRGRVTLLGDAVHPMTPFRGEGGNMAMTDALRMAPCIASLAGKDLSDTALIADALKTYEAEMTPRATKSVLGSRANSFANASFH